MGCLDDSTLSKHLATRWKQERSKWQSSQAASWTYALPALNDDDDQQQQATTTKTLTGGCTCGASRYRVAVHGSTELCRARLHDVDACLQYGYWMDNNDTTIGSNDGAWTTTHLLELSWPS